MIWDASDANPMHRRLPAEALQDQMHGKGLRNIGAVVGGYMGNTVLL